MRYFLSATVALACFTPFSAFGNLPAIASGHESLRDIGAALLSSVSDEQRGDMQWSFDDDEREDIHYAPFPLDGVEHGELDPPAASLTESLLRTALSARGHAKIQDIRNLELAVREKERSRFWSFAMRGYRDPERYLLAIFGTPDGGGHWGFRYEGHHLSLNVTDVAGHPPVTTPLFLGAEPRVVPDGWPSAGVAVLGEEEQLARRLYASLPAQLQERATLPYEDGRDLMLGQVRRVGSGDKLRGVSRGEMGPSHQALLDDLVARFTTLWSPEVAAARQAEIDLAGRDGLTFAFAAADEPEHAFYVRIQGPRTLLEIDNTSDGDHVHAVWHDLENDFGDDVLAAHWLEHHGVVIGQR